jgi:hypothetical protein
MMGLAFVGLGFVIKHPCNALRRTWPATLLVQLGLSSRDQYVEWNVVAHLLARIPNSGKLGAFIVHITVQVVAGLIVSLEWMLQNRII